MQRDESTRREALILFTATGFSAMGCGDGDVSPGGAAGSSGQATGGKGGGSGGSPTSSAGAAGEASGGAPSDGGQGPNGEAGEPGGAEGGAPGEGGGGPGPSGGGQGPTGEGGAGGEGAPECMLKPEQTLGPFPNKSQLNRSDIRAGQAGAAFRLRLRVLSVFGCVPVAGATVELWQCNSQGDYSEYSDFNTADQNWLRGYQVTNDAGVVEFVTIYPGWYPGRSVHVHFRVKRQGRADFASQLYFDDAFSDVVLAQAPYTSHTGTRPTNPQDSIFVADGGNQLILAVTESLTELRATFDIGIPA